jgi:membrane-bound lytic murein transglycosylase B
MKRIKILSIFIFLSLSINLNANESEFNKWLISFKNLAIKKGISEKTLKNFFSDVKFIPKVIEYDRRQPEFYEDTFTYIENRVTKSKIKNGKSIYKKNYTLINEVENKFSVEKELLLALMGIETNFGKYLGKMHIISSLATLSFDKRRSEFFTNELLVLLKLIDNKIIDPEILYGSWAGAFGNFQFMPSTITSYAIDYNGNKTIELKKIDDSFASAANYINKIGWKKNSPCFKYIKLKKNIPKIYLNTSAGNIKNRKKIKFFKKYILNYNEYNFDEREFVAIITPDKDIIPGSKDFSPAYIVFSNYELILKWNRSLRFALAVCKLKNEFKNEL